MLILFHVLTCSKEYLTSLGISKPLLALVWLAGPVSGAFLQPYFCLRSDNCQSPWGRRKPYIAGGSIAIVLCLLSQAWAPELLNAAACAFGFEHGGRSLAYLTAATVVFFVIALNIAIQPVQGCLRALIVDSCVRDDQEAANAWAGRIISIANVASYVCGSIDLRCWFPYLGSSQFQVLCSITSFWLGVSIAITCWKTKDIPVIKSTLSTKKAKSNKLDVLLRSATQLPTQLKRVCMIQFFSWMGWFPFLFYMDIYISDKRK